MANVDALLDLGDHDEPLSSPTGKTQRDSSDDPFIVSYGENDGEDAEEGEDEDMEEEEECQNESAGEYGEQPTSTSLDEFDPFATTETTETVESVTSGDGVIRTTTVTKTVTRSRSQSHSSGASEGENRNDDESQFDDLLGGLATDTMTTTSGTSPKIATTNGVVSSESNAIDDGAAKTTGYARKTNTKKAKTGNSQPAQQAQKSSKPAKGQRGNSEEEQEQLPHTAKAQPKTRAAPAPENTQVSSGHNKHNKGRSSAPAPTNHEVVEKFAPPPIAHNVRAMFESGQIPDLHEVKKGPLDINEATESGVYENEPEFLEGVVRSTDVNMSGETVEKGKTKNIVKDWKHKGQTPTKKSAPINIMEGDGCVRESSPIVRDDVVRSGLPDNYEAELPKRGSAKGVLTKWGARKEAPQKKEIKLIEGDNTEPMVAENEPEIRDDLIHAEESIEFEVGKTRNLAGYWATRTDDVPFNRQVDDAGIDVRVANTRSQFLDKAQGDSISKQPFVMELADGGPSVVENEPCMLDDNVVRSSTYVEEVVPGERGRIRNMAERIANTPDAPRQRRQIVIDRSDGPCVVENEPSQLDDGVIRADMQSDIVSVDSGHTRSLMDRWRNFEVEANTPKTSTSAGGKPSWIREMEAATESGVYENEPEERADVVREADNDSEAGMELHTREVKKMWTSKENERDGPRSKTPEVISKRAGGRKAAASENETDGVKQSGVARRGVKHRGGRQEQVPSEPEPVAEPVPQRTRPRWGGAKTQTPEVKPDPIPDPIVDEVKPKGRPRWGAAKTQIEEVKPEPIVEEVKPKGRPRRGGAKTQTPEVKPDPIVDEKPKGRPRWGAAKTETPEDIPDAIPDEVKPKGRPRWGGVKALPTEPPPKRGDLRRGGPGVNDEESNRGEVMTARDEGPSLRNRPVSKWGPGGKKKPPPPPVKPKPKATDPEAVQPEPEKKSSSSSRRKPYKFKEDWRSK